MALTFISPGSGGRAPQRRQPVKPMGPTQPVRGYGGPSDPANPTFGYAVTSPFGQQAAAAIGARIATTPITATRPPISGEKADDQAASKPGGGVDYSHDPVLQNVIAGNDATLQSVKAQTLAEQKRLLIGFGSKNLAREILGGDAVVDAISDDPNASFSTLANIGRAYGQQRRDLNENLNQRNLFYSGARNRLLGDLDTMRLQDETEAERGLRAQLSALQGNVGTVEAQLRDKRIQAENEAYLRAVQAAIDAGSTGETDPAEGSAGMIDPNIYGQIPDFFSPLAGASEEELLKAQLLKQALRSGTGKQLLTV